VDQDELNKVELPAIAQLKQLGWHYTEGAALNPESQERAFFRDVVLVKRLEASIKRINPWISEENLRKVMRI
jgi:type I restriction enzyme R subunit